MLWQDVRLSVCHTLVFYRNSHIQQCSYWYAGRWWVGCYIWYCEEGPSLLLAVPNVTGHPSTASVSTSYYSMCHLPLHSEGLTVNGRWCVAADCRRLNCMDICISDGGRRAHCICRMGYQLTDHRRCGREFISFHFLAFHFIQLICYIYQQR